MLPVERCVGGSNPRRTQEQGGEFLAEEIAKRVVTYQNGSPSTIIGPPTSGARVLNEFWRDALDGEWRWTVAGTPGTWLQSQAGAYSRETTVGATPALQRPAGGFGGSMTLRHRSSVRVPQRVVERRHMP